MSIILALLCCRCFRRYKIFALRNPGLFQAFHTVFCQSRAPCVENTVRDWVEVEQLSPPRNGLQRPLLTRSLPVSRAQVHVTRGMYCSVFVLGQERLLMLSQ